MADIGNENDNSRKNKLVCSALCQNRFFLRGYVNNEKTILKTNVKKPIADEYELYASDTSHVKLESQETSLISNINYEEEIEIQEVKIETEEIAVIADLNAEDPLIIPQIKLEGETLPLRFDVNDINLVSTSELKSENKETSLIDFNEENLLSTLEGTIKSEQTTAAPCYATITTTATEISKEHELNLMAIDERDDDNKDERVGDNVLQKTNASSSSQCMDVESTSTNTITKPFLKECAPFFDETGLKYLKCLVSLEKRHTNNYSLGYKMLCLSLYYNSPWAYTFLQESLSLMSLNGINSITVPVTSVCNQYILDLIKTKISLMTTQEKMFIVCVKTIPLDEKISYDVKNDHIFGFQEINNELNFIVGNTAVVVMIHGLHTNAKYIVSNVILGELTNYQSLMCWIKCLIKKLLDIGLDIRALISDFGELTSGIAKCLGINENMTKFAIDDTSIYYIFSSSSLLVNARDQFIRTNFYFGNGKLARWEHIIEFHKQDTLKTSSKLNVLNPNVAQCMVLIYAMAIFNNNLATALRSSSIADASDTSDLLLQFSRMFELLSIAEFREDNIYVCGNVYQKEGLFMQIATFLNTLVMFSKEGQMLYFEDFTFIDGFKITVESVKNLIADLESEGCKTLHMCNLTQGFTHDFMNVLHQGNDLVTAQHLNTFLEGMNLKYILENANDNYAYDLSESLSRITSFMENYSVVEKMSGDVFVLTNISESDYQVILPSSGAMIVVAQHIMKACLKVHKTCKKLKAYNEKSKDHLLSAITAMDRAFVNFFSDSIVPNKIGVGLLEAFDQLDLKLPCKCFPDLYMKAMFIRIRLHNINDY